ncbi:MAG: head GIN domain-containing protein [Mucilaginibacter sp.]|uniref:head GIN domain-containing protein n=1 Tax=Mucilaginibacter sp. TaxID=1882438 RepID=UPI0031A5060B
MRSLTKLLLAITLTTGTASYTIAKSSSIITIAQNTEDRHISGFSSVEVGGSFDVFITQGSTESVKVTAPSDIISNIITEVEGGVLKIHTKKGSNWNDVFGHKKIVVYVSAKTLNGIALAGSGDVRFDQGVHGNAFKLRLSGSGDLSGKLDVKTLETSLSGSGDIKISGKADDSSISIAGSGDFSGKDLVTNSTSIRVAGSGDAKVNVNQKLDASVVGSGDIYYTGGVKQVSTSKAGSGDIHRM